MIAKLLGVRIFDVEASGVCNLHCPFCPREYLPQGGVMSQDTFTRFLDHVPLRHTDTVSFVGLGEPTLNRRLPDFIRQVKARYPGAQTWVTSNGTNLNERALPPLLAAGLDTLDVSFHGLDKETYERNMRGANFEKSLAALDYAVAEIRRTGAATKLQINYMVSQENAAEEEQIQAFWRARGIHQFRPQRLHNRAGLSKVRGLTPTDKPGLGARPCAVFELVTFVTWRGEVLYCCHDIPRKHVIGNFREDTWETIQARKREIIAQNNWPAMCRACTDPLRHDMTEQIDRSVRREIRTQAARGIRAPVRRLGAFFGRVGVSSRAASGPKAR